MATVFQRGFFDQRFDNWLTVHTTNICVLSILLTIECAIGAGAWLKMRTRVNIDLKLKALFMITVMFACIAVSGEIARSIMHRDGRHEYDALFFALALSNVYFFVCILATLVIRFV